jgi:hypothetical protein
VATLGFVEDDLWRLRCPRATHLLAYGHVTDKGHA